MNDYPITVVIPAFNAQATIERAVHSVLNQVNAACKVLVVDDGSGDNTASVVAELAKQTEDGRIRLIAHQANQGRLEARRTGINAVDTPFVLFLDADDELASDAANRMLAAQGGTFDIVQCSIGFRYIDYVDEGERRFNEEFTRAPMREVTGDDITHLVFRDRRTTWSLCAKLMRTGIVREAFTHIPAAQVNLAEDVCTFFVISCLAQSYKGIGSYAGYIYHIDLGGSLARNKVLDLQQYTFNCKCIDAMNIVRDYLVTSGKADALQADYDVLWHEHARALADKLLYCVPAPLQPQAFDTFVELWGACAAIAALSEAGWEEPADVLEAVASAQALQCLGRVGGAEVDVLPASPTPGVKTVGVYNYAMDIGGAERVAAELAQLWQRQGYQVVFFADCPREECSYPLSEDITWVQLPVSAEIGREGYGARAAAIQQAIDEWHIDVLVHHQWWNSVLAWDMLLFKALGVPVCAYVHSIHTALFYSGRPREFDVTRILRHADALMVLSECDRAFWQKFIPRVYRTNNPSTIAPGSVERSNLEGENIIWVGRLSAYDKQPAEAIEIMARVAGAEPDATLTMVGVAPSKSELADLKALARARGIEDRVRFVGAQDDLVPLYQNASVYVLTSRWEGYSLTLAESKAVGLPCVMYELPYLTLTQGNRGIRAVPQGDREAAARTIVELLRSSELRAQLGQQAYDHICEVEAFDYASLWQTVFADLATGSVPRDGYEQVDAEWDLLLDAMKEAVRVASNPSFLPLVKKKGYNVARRMWHRVNGMRKH